MTKLSIYIDDSGLEAVAAGQEGLRYWYFQVRGEGDGPPKNSFMVAEGIEFTLPDRDTATRIAVTVLREKKNQIYLNAQREATEIEERIQNLLALEGPTS